MSFIRNLLFLLLIQSPVILFAQSTSPSLSNFTVEYATNPLAVDIDWNPSPRFGWTLTNAEQSAYQITVINSYTSAVVWYSGIIVSSTMSQIPYQGSNPLLYETDYIWYVNVTVQSNPSYPYLLSPNQTFTTSPNSTWFATVNPWIGGCTTDQHSPQLRYSFLLDSQPITRARVYVTGLGIYTFYVNGVGPGYNTSDDNNVLTRNALTPGWSTIPTARVLANAYDILPFLSGGLENVVGMRLGQGKYGYVYEFCTAGDATCYAANAHIVIHQANGNVTTISTSTDWTCAPSPIVFNHLFGGETYNSSLEQPGWNNRNFIPNPTIPWTNVNLQFPNVSLVSTGGMPSIQIMHDITAVSVTNGSAVPVISGGEFVISSSSPNVWWVANNSGIKNFVVECQPCPAIDACGNLHTVPQSYIDSLTQGANFSCSMLPNSTVANSYIFDFGRNMAGFCTIRLPPAPASTILTLVHGEILDPSGNVDNTFGASTPPRTCNVNVINCADQMDQIIYGNTNVPSSYTPSFTFHGFRYVALFGWPSGSPFNDPDLYTVVCHQAYTGIEDGGYVQFNQSYPDLNNIQAAIVQTQKSNIFSIPSDCPTREKRGWQGDAQVSSNQALLNLRMGPLYENWARSHSDTLFMSCWNPSASPFHGSNVLAATVYAPERPAQYLCCGNRNEFGCQPGLTPFNATNSLPDVIPFDSISGWPGDFIWQISGEVIPYNTFKQENNLPYLQLLWPYITGHLEFASTSAALNPDGLIRYGPYADWLATEGVSRDYSENWYYLLSMTLGAELASALGNSNQAIAYTALANTIATTMVQKYFNTTGNYWDGSINMNAQAMALAVNLGGNSITVNQTVGIANNMATDCTNRGFHPTGGVASVRYILQGLVAGNYSLFSLNMATVETSPSWAYMAQSIMPGTIWEEWSGSEHESDGSKNHPMLTGGIGTWLYENALGLRFYHQIQASTNDVLGGNVPKPLPELFISTTAIGFDPRYRGLTDEETLQALRLSEQALSAMQSNHGAGQVWTINDYLTMVTKMNDHTQKETNIVRTITPTVTIMPDPALVMQLGSAAGWHQIPSGNCTLNWQYDTMTAASFTLTGFIPSGGVKGRFGLPLAVLHRMLTSNNDKVLRIVVKASPSSGSIGNFEEEMLTGTVHITETAATTMLTILNKCSILGTTDNGLYTVHFCTSVYNPRRMDNGQILHFPTVLTYTAMEDNGRLTFVGEPDRTPTVQNSYIYMETNWGQYRIELTMENK